jgi:hypothetical protein
MTFEYSPAWPHGDLGILVTCDAVQSWANVDRFFSPETAAQYLADGRIRPADIPPTWLEACAPDAADFRRLLALDFRHLVSAHGEPLLDDARARLRARVEEIFGPASSPAAP